MIKKIFIALDKLEDKIRGKLSYKPFIYAFLGGVGVVLFWRGIWHTNDFFVDYYTLRQTFDSGLIWWDGPLSLVVGSILLLSIGVFVSSFIGNEIIISGVKGEKKLTEKTEKEIKSELQDVERIKKDMKKILNRLIKIEKKSTENDLKR